MKDQKNDSKSMEDKTYFLPGDLVTIKQNLPNKPTMLVVKKETNLFKNKVTEDSILKGIRCRWFTKEGLLQEAIFNTKDLILIKN